MPLRIRSKFIVLLNKIRTLTEISIQVEELINLPLEEIVKKTNYIKPTKEEQKIVSLLKKKLKEYELALKLSKLNPMPLLVSLLTYLLLRHSWIPNACNC